MDKSQLAFATGCFLLTLFALGHDPTRAAPPTDELLDQRAVLDRLVGSWVLESEAKHGLSACQECKWILNKRFFQIDTKLTGVRSPSSAWRTIIEYDQENRCFQQWKFSDNGEVNTARGTWNEKTSSLVLSGRTPNGNDSESKIEIVDDKTIVISEREFLDDEHTRIGVVRFVLGRVRVIAPDRSKPVM